MQVPLAKSLSLVSLLQWTYTNVPRIGARLMHAEEECYSDEG